MNNTTQNGKPVVILFIAVIILILISLLPINYIFDGSLRSYNLFSELIDNDTVNIEDFPTNDNIQTDPLLISIDSIDIDTETLDKDTLLTEIISHAISLDSNYIAVDSFIAPRQGDHVIIEDYTGNGSALKHLKNAIVNQQSLNRPVRIAMLGDSYIEGDIFSQHIREQLQDIYGGGGVGYVNMHSDFPGFRRSLRQSSNGWNVHDFVKNNVSSRFMTISQQYSVSRGVARSTYKGTDYANHLNNWEHSKFLFISNYNATITLSTDNKTISHNVISTPGVIQCLQLSDTTNIFKLNIDSDSLIGIGVWLENKDGITFDCMSTRGSSGITLARVNNALAQQMSQYIQYDLIILEFGMNAMTAGQKNFSGYTHTMEKVITHIRQCYPDTDILIMGIGDRASKRGTEVHSMSNVPIMVNAQRALAQKCRCAFWDTREAMGGEDASVRWANEKFVNKDYIHLSYTGGRKLATEFVKSLTNALND